MIRHAGAQSGIQVALTPLGARSLLGLPAGELASVDVPAEAVLGTDCPRIHDRVRAATDWPERFAVLDEAFGSLRDRHETEAVPEVDCAWRLLLGSGGTVPVSELAAETGWSGRHLASRFRAEIGLGPKAAARVIRFDHARRSLISSAGAAGLWCQPGGTLHPGPPWPKRPGLGLADLAVACGYFDQAHLAREFRALAGCPPSQWLTEEFRNIHVGAWLAEEGW
jgi:AraC-like DNA-binding protein